MRNMSIAPVQQYPSPRPVARLLPQASFKRADVVSLVLALVAFALWIFSLHHIDVSTMNDLGLVSALATHAPLLIIAPFLLTFSFCLTLRQPQMRTWLILLHIALLIAMLYGVENLIEEAPRFSVVYRHAGYTEYIMRHGSVNPALDAYFNWPGFFVLSAFVTEATGFHSILPYAGWAPLVYNLLYFGPIYLILTTATTDRRLTWLGLWFFYLTNWIGQDYFSPQGINFFFYVVIIAILLKWFKVTTLPPPRVQDWLSRRLTHAPSLVRGLCNWSLIPDMQYTPSTLTSWQRRGLLALLLLLFLFVVSSHPLTPFFVVTSVALLVVFRRCKPFWLPLVFGAMTAAWMFLMAKTYLQGHSQDVVSGIGHITSAVTVNVTQRASQGDAQHVFIAYLRIVMSVLIWGLAVLGVWRRIRMGNRDLTYLLLAIAPFPLAIVQQYGGEMFLRVYLFSLPFMVMFAATSFYTRHSLSLRGTSLPRIAVICAVCFMLLAGFFFTRYGNERMDYMTNSDVAGVQYLYAIAPTNSMFIAGWDDTPWMFQGFELYSTYTTNDIDPNMMFTPDKPNINEIVQFIKAHPHSQAYFIFTRSQSAWATAFSSLPADALPRFENALIASGKFRVVYHSGDVEILRYVRRRV